MDSTQLSNNAVQAVAAPLLSEWTHLLTRVEGHLDPHSSLVELEIEL